MIIIVTFLAFICMLLLCPATVTVVAGVSGKDKYGSIAGVIMALVIVGYSAYIVIADEKELGKEVARPVISMRMTGSLERDYGSRLVNFSSVLHRATIVEPIPLIKNGESGCGFTFTIENADAKLRKAESLIEVRLGDEVVASGEWSASVSCDKIELGKTNFEVVASNTKGIREEELVVEKYSVKEGCEKFDPTNTSNACRVLAAHIAAMQKPQEETKPTQGGGNSSGSASKCLNYQGGKCWDEVEDAGYDDGYDDGWMGMRYGASFFDSLPAGFRNCTGVCEDVYEDAYREGYEDGKMDAKDDEF